MAELLSLNIVSYCVGKNVIQSFDALCSISNGLRVPSTKSFVVAAAAVAVELTSGVLSTNHRAICLPTMAKCCGAEKRIKSRNYFGIIGKMCSSHLFSLCVSGRRVGWLSASAGIATGSIATHMVEHGMLKS